MAVYSQVVGYLSYFFNEVNEHSLQTPFLYDLYTKAITSTRLNGDFSDIETIRAKLLANKSTIKGNELGAPSAVNRNNERTIADIAKNSSTPQKYSALFYRLIKYFNLRTIIELGTSLGVNTLYLAKYEATKVVTFEGCPETAAIAQKNFDEIGAHNIEIIEGDIDKTLSSNLNGGIKPDLFYIDANHNYGPTMHYFDLVLRNKNDNSICIIDDIHWSGGMSKAWREISNHPEVMLSLNLYRCGIVFFKHDLTKQHFSLRF